MNFSPQSQVQKKYHSLQVTPMDQKKSTIRIPALESRRLKNCLENRKFPGKNFTGKWSEGPLLPVYGRCSGILRPKFMWSLEVLAFHPTGEARDLCQVLEAWSLHRPLLLTGSQCSTLQSVPSCPEGIVSPLLVFLTVPSMPHPHQS